MKQNHTILLIIGLAALGCGNEASTGAAGSASAGASAAAAGSGAAKPTTPAVTGDKDTCAGYGAEGEGTFQKPCNAKAPGPFAAKWTGEVEKGISGDEVMTISIESKAERDVTWGVISTWCYDKDGNQLEFTPIMGTTKIKRYYRTGSGIFRSIKPGKDKLAPGDTLVTEGPPKKMVPEGTDHCAVEVTSWGWEAPKKLYFRADRPKVENLDIRPDAGFE
jgi:hypothetical protein